MPVTLVPCSCSAWAMGSAMAQGYCWDFPIAIAAARDIPLEKFITHTFPLEQLQQALDTALDSKSGSIKVILKP